DTIEEEAERLNRFVGNLLNMTRLEAGALTLAPAAFELRESLGRLVEAYGRRPGGGALSLQIEGDMLVAQGDVILFEQAMGNILENALKFSPDGAPIQVSARPVARGLMVEVTDQGPGVPEADLERIFEKFYRFGGEEDRQGGAGLGLSIVRGLLEAMGGTAVARNRKEGGLVLSVCLPGAAA
ncbi:MAG TPA: ATP-binding protein, partial [Phenylobacterium sp.]|nr:ATP-binding protein [Phenylobacterium sp.]